MNTFRPSTRQLSALKKNAPHIVLTICAVLAAAVLFITSGRIQPAAPFTPIHLDGPIVVDSDGELSVVVDD